MQLALETHWHPKVVMMCRRWLSRRSLSRARDINSRKGSSNRLTPIPQAALYLMRIPQKRVWPAVVWQLKSNRTMEQMQ